MTTTILLSILGAVAVYWMVRIAYSVGLTHGGNAMFDLIRRKINSGEMTVFDFMEEEPEDAYMYVNNLDSEEGRKKQE